MSDDGVSDYEHSLFEGAASQLHALDAAVGKLCRVCLEMHDVVRQMAQGRVRPRSYEGNVCSGGSRLLGNHDKRSGRPRPRRDEQEVILSKGDKIKISDEEFEFIG